jgi:hypothetical protein
MTATKKASVLMQVKDMAQRCAGLAKICDEDDEGYLATCLENATQALDLALKRLRGESTRT